MEVQMKMFLNSGIKSFFCAAVLLCAGTEVKAEVIQIKLGDFQATTHIVSKEGTVKWMQEVEKRTNGKVKFQHFPSEQAAKSKSLLDAVKKDILDVALIGPLYHSDQLPLNSIIGLPGFFSSAIQGTVALQSLIANGPIGDEFKANGVIPLMAFVLPPYNILLKDKKIGKLSDWKGLNIRSAGSTQAMTARSLGAAGVSIPGPETYSALERGRVNGVFFPLSSVPSYNLQEVSGAISTNGFFGGYSFTLVMKDELFKSLPADVQKVMLEVGEEVGVHVAKAQDDSISDLTAQWAAKGVDIYQFTPEEKAELNQAISGVKDDWVERVSKQTPEAVNVLAAYEKLIAQ
jgi:TRAP-type transport system periplasmic protein